MSQFSVAARSLQHSPHRTDLCETCAVRDIAACSSLNADDRRRLTSIIDPLRAAPHRLIFEEGEPADHVFTVTDGAVKIYKTLKDGRRQVTGFLFPGDFLGLLDNNVYAYSAETLTPAQFCRFPRSALEALLKELPRLEQRLLGMASHEIAAAQEQMLLLGRKSARERVASFLLMLWKAASGDGPTAKTIALPMSRADIADYLGLTMETVSRKLTQLGSQHIIEILGDKRVCVVNFPALCRAAGAS
jgi:CRP/FNR family transcriptional regulator